MLLFVASGPTLSVIGYLAEWPVLFWLGVALALINLWMDGMSGVMKFPILPLLFVIFGAATLSPWWYGSAVGVLAWTALEAIGILFTKLRNSN
ncbi:MAG: hypothetical protein H0T56_16730 [Pseudaminobacter sp.]|nr:hypothetical protein [Pseudaminobacter sp.]